MLWPRHLNRKIKNNFNLSGLTTFKIGGAAKFFLEPKDLKTLKEALLYSRDSGLKVFILGAGSNVLIDEQGLGGTVIRLNSDFFSSFKNKGVLVQAGAGIKLNRLILLAMEKGLSGLEFLSGIPGTLGGAVMGNAGAWGSSIGEFVEEISVLDYNAKARKLKKKDLKFGYRKSNLGGCIILSAVLRLEQADKNEVSSKIKEYLGRRKKSQENSLPNAGCIFKNPHRQPAGFLIEACGLKGKSKGGALVSNKHANFILNSKKAKSADVLFLMDLIQKKVKDKFNITLEPEIKIWK